MVVFVEEQGCRATGTHAADANRLGGPILEVPVAERNRAFIPGGVSVVFDVQEHPLLPMLMRARQEHRWRFESSWHWVRDTQLREHAHHCRERNGVQVLAWEGRPTAGLSLRL